MKVCERSGVGEVRKQCSCFTLNHKGAPDLQLFQARQAACKDNKRSTGLGIESEIEVQPSKAC